VFVGVRVEQTFILSYL